MKVGDLVKYRETTEWPQWEQYIGVIVKEIPGTEKVKVVRWTNHGHGITCSHPERELQVISKTEENKKKQIKEYKKPYNDPVDW